MTTQHSGALTDEERALVDKVLVKNDGRHGDPLYSPYQWQTAIQFARIIDRLTTAAQDAREGAIASERQKLSDEAVVCVHRFFEAVKFSDDPRDAQQWVKWKSLSVKLQEALIYALKSAPPTPNDGE